MDNPLARAIAPFPACPTCGRAVIEPVSQAAVWVQVGDDPPQKVNRSEAAGFWRFIAREAPHGVVAQQTYEALGKCINVSRVVYTERRRFGRDAVPCEERSKVNKPGNFGIYYLPAHVRVWDVDEEEGR